MAVNHAFGGACGTSGKQNGSGIFGIGLTDGVISLVLFDEIIGAMGG
jgi:hypothetical protein